MSVVRDEKGRVVSGVLNPGGRPRDEHKVAELARAHAPEALKKLVDLMENGPPEVQLRAAEALLNRGYGRPSQSVDARLEVKQSLPDLHLEALKAHNEKVKGRTHTPPALEFSGEKTATR